MSEKSTLKPLAIALGATFASTLAIGGANAAENPFGQAELAGGYMVAENSAEKTPLEGKCGEGKCGGMKAGAAPRCDMKTLDADGDGKVSKDEFAKHHDAMFTKMDADGDGTLDASEHGNMMPGTNGGKTMPEMKCGAGMK